jgi:hypothetical protein
VQNKNGGAGTITAKNAGRITAMQHPFPACNPHHRGGPNRRPEWQGAAKKACRRPQIYYILNKKYSNNQAEAKGLLPVPKEE